MVDTVRADSTYFFNIALEYETTYYLYVRQACDVRQDCEGNEWESISFTTPYAIRYEAEFESTTLPGDWSRYTGLLNDVLAGTAQLASTTSGWSLVSGTTAVNENHFKGNIFSTWAYWVVSPLVSLAAPAGSAVQLHFDAAYNKWNDVTTDPALGKDDRFVVLVSTNNGASWTKLSEWNNSGSGDYVLNNVPKEGKTYFVDLSAYVGQSLRVAFYGESTESNADNDFHFGNIVINYNVTENFEATICNGNDYDGNGFHVTDADYHIGSNVFEWYVPAANGSGLPDSLSTLNLTVVTSQAYEDSVTICEGEHFSDTIHGVLFDFDAIVGMQDRVQFVQNQFGCEDVVKLMITVLPKVETHIQDSVAQGDEYEWHGVKYISTTTATFDTISLVTGCDSTVYLHLTVYQKEQAIPGVHAQSLLIAPNPVKVGEPIRVLTPFVADELAGAKVEIVSATGVLIYEQEGANDPFVLPGIPVSGVYIVRIVIGNDIYISSLMVN